MITVKDSVFDEQQPGPMVICLERAYGSMNLQALARLDAHLLEAVDGSSTGLLIDLSETVSIGCRFLDVLLRCYARTTQCNRRFAVCALNPWPARVLAVTRLRSLWETFRSRQEGIQAMQWPMVIPFK